MRRDAFASVVPEPDARRRASPERLADPDGKVRLREARSKQAQALVGLPHLPLELRGVVEADGGVVALEARSGNKTRARRTAPLPVSRSQTVKENNENNGRVIGNTRNAGSERLQKRQAQNRSSNDKQDRQTVCMACFDRWISRRMRSMGGRLCSRGLCKYRSLSTCLHISPPEAGIAFAPRLSRMTISPSAPGHGCSWRTGADNRLLSGSTAGTGSGMDEHLYGL
jgi:hypothetical protein